MITAVLTDKKGFRKSIDIPRRVPVFHIPICPTPSAIMAMSIADFLEKPPKIEQIDFYFDGWIDEKEGIAHYIER